MLLCSPDLAKIKWLNSDVTSCVTTLSRGEQDMDTCPSCLPTASPFQLPHWLGKCLLSPSLLLPHSPLAASSLLSSSISPSPSITPDEPLVPSPIRGAAAPTGCVSIPATTMNGLTSKPFWITGRSQSIISLPCLLPAPRLEHALIP